MRYLRIYFLSIFLFMILSCSKNGSTDIETIVSYLEENNISYKDTLGVFIHFDRQGSDLYPNANSKVEIAYTATYLDGEVFDRSTEGTFVLLSLREAIPGLQEGMKAVPKDAQVVIYIPSSLGFGSNPVFGVRKNAILVYQIYVKDILN